MRANLPLSTKSIFLIVAILLIPTTLVLAANNDIDCAGTDGFCEGTDVNDSMLGTSDIELIKAKDGNDLVFGLGNAGGGVSPEDLMGGDGGDEIVGDDDVLGLCVNPCFIKNEFTANPHILTLCNITSISSKSTIQKVSSVTAS